MNIDFHYGVIYVVSRLAGLSQDDAKTVAHSCQYVDDSTTDGVLHFAGGETFERFASAHGMWDYMNAIKNEDNRLVWAPFHFLPAGEGKVFEDRAVCKPDSQVAREMVKRALAKEGADNSLHRLGITLHVYIDTWAHQGFSGMISKHNTVTTLDGDDHDHDTWLEKLSHKVSESVETLKARGLDVLSGLGHGAALHFPDMPWAKWTYTNGHGLEFERDNLPDFMQAADMACKVVQGYIHGNTEYEQEPGLSEDAKAALQEIISQNKSHNGEARLQVLKQKLENGSIPGLKEEMPDYIPKGEGSWKHAATGITVHGDGHSKPEWSPAFEDSDYRKHHDAVKDHRFIVINEILPSHGIRMA